MTWMLWVVAGWFVVSTLIVVGSVGKERKPIEPSTAVGAAVINGALITLVMFGGIV